MEVESELLLLSDVDALVAESDELLRALAETEPCAASSSESSGSTDTPAPTRKRSHNSTRDREKQEIAYLRKFAADLERDLRDLRRHGRRAQERNPQVQAIAAAGWERLAERQRRNRELAQSENARLRELVHENARFIEKLSRMVYERQRVHEDLSHMKANASMGSNWFQRHVIDSMKHEATIAYGKARSVFHEHGIRTDDVAAIAAAPHRYDHDIREDGTSTLICVQAIPFRIEPTAAAMWRTISTWCTRHGHQPGKESSTLVPPDGYILGLFQNVERTNDTSVNVARTTTKFGSMECPMNIYEVASRFYEENAHGEREEVIVWRLRVVVDVAQGYASSSVVQMDSVGWITVDRIPSAAHMSIPSAVVCAQVTHIDGKRLGDTPAKPGSVLHAMLKSNEQCMSMLTQYVEDDLMKLA